MNIFSTKSPFNIDKKYISNVNYGGLKGRVVTLPAEKNPEHSIIIFAGHHSTHERMYSFADFLTQFGTVHMIDLPGFGGMNTFESINKPTTYESYAEYIYTVLKARKLTNNVTLLATSISSEYITRMFQLYPDSTKWIGKYIAFVGFGSGKDFNIKPFTKFVYMSIVLVGSTRIGAIFIRTVFLNPISLIPLMEIFGFFKQKMQHEDPKLKRQNIQMEKHLWTVNSIYTQAQTAKIMFKLDMRTLSENKIPLTCHNVLANNDQYLDANEVRKTFLDLYNEYQEHQIGLDVHMPSMVSNRAEIAQMFPDDLIKVLKAHE